MLLCCFSICEFHYLWEKMLGSPSVQDKVLCFLAQCQLRKALKPRPGLAALLTTSTGLRKGCLGALPPPDQGPVNLEACELGLPMNTESSPQPCWVGWNKQFWCSLSL